MKRTALALIVALLFSLVTGAKLVNLAEANWLPVEINPTVSITSPENKTYNGRQIPLSFVLSYPNLTLKNFSYVLDGSQVFIELDQMEEIVLSGLSEGSHIMSVIPTLILNPVHPACAAAPDHYVPCSDTVDFTVDTVPPRITVFSLENKTYNTTDIELDFAINETTAWMGYSLDDRTNVTITSNATLTGLPPGSHSLRIFANDTAGNTGVSDTVSFSIAKGQVPEPFPTIWVVVAIAGSVAVIYAGIIVHCKKRKRQREGKGE